MKKIIDTTSGDEIKGRIGRFVVSVYRRGEGTEGPAHGIFHGMRKPVSGVLYAGKAAILAACDMARHHNRGAGHSFDQVVSLYDKGTKTWWPVTVKESE